MSDIDPKLLLVEAAYHAVKWLVDKARHASTSADESELRDIAKKVAESAVQHAALELQLRGFVLATEVLDAAAQELLAAIREAEKTPSILPPAEIMPPSWHPSDPDRVVPGNGDVTADFDTSDTPLPDGGKP